LLHDVEPHNGAAVAADASARALRAQPRAADPPRHPGEREAVGRTVAFTRLAGAA